MSALKDEITTDPLGRGYFGMTDQQVADDLNTSYRSRNRDLMPATEVLNAIDITEFNLLTDVQEEQFWRLMAIGDLNPFGVEATIMIALFGGGSTTITTLQALRVESITRAVELPGVEAPAKVGHVEAARAP